jgi:hypothetical protein
MKNGLAVLFACVWLGACCMNGMTGLAPSGLRYTPDPWLVNWGPTYDSSRLADGDPSTYWCAPSGTAFPIVTIVQLESAQTLGSVDFDTRVVGYETSGIREVTIEPLAAGGMSMGFPVHAVLNANALTTVPLSQSGVHAVRFTFASNYGGSYAAMAELVLRSDLGTGMAPLPAIAVPSVPPVPPPSGLGVPTEVAPPSGAAGVIAATGGPGVPYVVDGAVPAFSGYGTDLMHDGNPGTYWSSPPSPYFPFVMTLTLSPPTTISAVEINSAIAAYPDIGPADVTILTVSDTGAILNVTSATLPPNASTRIPLVAPVAAAQLRLTIQGNHGGTFAGIAELSIMP